MVRILSLAFLITFGLGQSFAQPSSRVRASLRGKILNNKSQPVQAASVYISDLRVGATTNDNGEFVLTNIPEGSHLIEISHVSYVTITEEIVLRGDVTRNFILTEAIVEANEVVITGVGTATQSRRAPIPITVIRSEELMRNASTNIIEALTRKPGISSITTGPGISKPVIRGLSHNRIITMNDGIKQEGQQWGDEHGIEIDESSVNKVEIVKGPAALIYGSDALGGVINIFTNVPVPEGVIRGTINSNYQTNNNLRRFSQQFAGNKRGISWNFYNSTARAADYQNKLDGRVFNSKFRQNNVGGYLGYNSSWGFTHLILSSYKEKVGIVEGERDDEGFFIKPVSGGTSRATAEDFRSSIPQVPYQNINHFKIALDNSFRLANYRLNVTTGYQRNQRREFGEPDSPETAGLYFDLKTYNYRGQLHLPMRNNWKMSVGINGLHQTNTNKGSEFLIPEYTMNDVGAYIFSQKNVKNVSISGGLRFDNRQLTSNELLENGSTKFERFERRFSNFSGSIGASIRLDSALIIKGNVARGFRAPSIPELASNGTHEGTNRYEYGNKEIDSETSIQLDGGIEFSTDHFSFIVNAFHNQFDNFIFYRKLSAAGGGDSLVNVDGENIVAFQFDQQQARVNGFEVKFDLHPHPLDWLHLENTLSVVRGILKNAIEGARNLPFMPADRMISELRADFLKDRPKFKNLYLKVELDHTFRQNRIFHAFDTETYTDPYTLLNAGIGFDIAGPKRQTLLSFHFIGNNLTDVAWQSHLSRLKYGQVNQATGNRGVYNMGRNFSFRVNVPFSF
jgi:iron complex outermembrane recepter protein